MIQRCFSAKLSSLFPSYILVLSGRTAAMRDPLGPCPLFLRDLATSAAEAPLKLTTLPLHVHEIVLAFVFYTTTSHIVSPWLGKRYLPKTYPSLPRRTRINWDIHVTSFVQSSLICTVALWVLLRDDEVRGDGSWKGRIGGYSGAAGMTQALAAGYFLWDVMTCSLYFDTQGIGALMHGVSALIITLMGFVSSSNFLLPGLF